MHRITVVNLQEYANRIYWQTYPIKTELQPMQPPMVKWEAASTTKAKEKNL